MPLENHDLHKELVRQRLEKIKSFKAKMDSRRRIRDKIADFLTESFGTVPFLGIHFIWFVIWILINTNFFPSIPAFDPFPFGLLTMVVSLEAIFLSVIVLISQNRAASIAEIREEIDLRINIQAEREITKMLIILDRIHNHLGLPAQDDAELIKMKKQTNLNLIEEELMKEILKK
ncbi:DUF1003 domain-containing protein [Candidatus Peregrinibacteria bacterium]|nr:DUF1003 domain-containing protein [Candidatus Peregrinibacteria bacterium]